MTTTSTSALLLASAFAAGALAQTAHRPVHTSAAATPARSSACVTLPEVSSKVPAVPAGSPCIHTLYTIVTEPNAKLENASGFAGADVARTLGLESSTISEDFIDTHIGTGALAQPDKFYSIQYTGYLTDGTKFDSSLDRGEPIVIHYGAHQVIPGWDTGFGGMHVGGKRRLFIPYQLAYGAQAHGPIPPKSMLIFDVELVAQSDTEPKPKPAPAAPKPATPQPAAGTQTPAAGAQPSAAGTPITPPAAKPATPPAATTPQPK